MQQAIGKHRQQPRSERRCAIDRKCGACAHVNKAYKPALIGKHHEDIKRLSEGLDLSDCKVIPPEESPTIVAYRCIAKLAIRANKLGEVSIGLFAPGTHDVVDITSCPLHSPTINRLLFSIKIQIQKLKLSIYNEQTKSGELRYLTIRSAHLTGELMVVFVTTSTRLRQTLRDMVKELRGSIGAPIHSAYININNGSGNQIYGDQTLELTGTKNLRESIADLNVTIGPTSFFQVNPKLAELIYRRIEQLVSYASGESQHLVAWDLYCGIGPISMILARAGYRVLGIEENPEAIELAQSNMRNNNLSKLATMVAGRVEDSFAEIPGWAVEPEVVVVNPSRRGLAEPVRQRLGKLASMGGRRTLIYVSCDLSTLTRDLNVLTKDGYTLRQVESFDMFSHTDKLEWLAVATCG